MSDLSIAQRRLVALETHREYQDWRRLIRAEPTIEERHYIAVMGYEDARKIDPSIPPRNPMRNPTGVPFSGTHYRPARRTRYGTRRRSYPMTSAMERTHQSIRGIRREYRPNPLLMTVMGNPMKLLTKADRKRLPPIRGQEHVADPIAYVKFFTPDSNWTWYATEFDGVDEFFGLVQGFEEEMGYFSLREIASARGPMGLHIERDKWFKPTPLSRLRGKRNPRAGRYAGRTRRGRPSKAKFVRQRLEAPGRFDKRSFRTIKRAGKEIVIGCPKGHWDARRQRCRVGTRAQTILHPVKKNPKYTVGRGPTERRISAATARRIMKKNPGGTSKKVTMPIEKYMELLKRHRDPKLIKAFNQKVSEYRKWTHGSTPKTVTVENVDVPGVSGVWTTMGMGTEPESRYVMPKGSKRKGAWRHPWGKAPALKGDAKAGIMLTRLSGSNRINDFMRG